ncbi:hypothetical protein SOCEGT47_036150 [Sorangium cellulosum]|uniref:Uncharacterized protein n=1 Tax=Sorangium cellulosum TaxID=56 RepID=A0A4P2Q2B8_SORCE|nr:hypothetical protein [Sorangium cellulosum]AUX23096.1 hypothetical protein SOCEGT47_036150 [Sorangium cellulosum]
MAPAQPHDTTSSAGGSARARRRARRWGLLALAGLPALGLGELAAHVHFSESAPDLDAYRALAAPLAAMRRPGDLVVVAPAWADPAARRALGDALSPLRDAARPDETRYAAAVEISALGQRAEELAGFREEARQEHGPFVLRRLVNPRPARVVYDFVEHVAPPSADVRVTDPPAACRWNPRARIAAGGLGGHPTFPAERFECPGGLFFNVGVTVIADEEFRPRRCIWSHPPRAGEIVTRFRGVPLGDVIRGHAGMYWIIERERKGAPVTLAVRVNGETVGEATHVDGDGWAPFEFPLGAHAGAAGAEVEFAVRTSDYTHRHYCFEADTR